MVVRLDESTDPADADLRAEDRALVGPEIGRYFDRTGLDREVAKVLDSRFEDRVVMLHWRERIAYRVDGSVPRTFMREALAQPGHTKDVRARAILAATDLLTWRRRAPMRSRRIRYDDVVRPELRRGDGSVLERRVYRVDALQIGVSTGRKANRGRPAGPPAAAAAAAAP